MGGEELAVFQDYRQQCSLQLQMLKQESLQFHLCSLGLPKVWGDPLQGKVVLLHRSPEPVPMAWEELGDLQHVGDCLYQFYGMDINLSSCNKCKINKQRLLT